MKIKTIQKQKTKKVLFVYGTLKKGYALNGYLSKGKFIGNALMKGYKMFMQFGIPYIVKDLKSMPSQMPCSENSKVYGEVYEFTDRDYYNLIPKLDYIESSYQRVLEDAYLIDEDNRKIEVEVYVYFRNPKDMERIESGIFECLY